MGIYNRAGKSCAWPISFCVLFMLFQFFVLTGAAAQIPETGLPNIKNYAPDVYGSHPQNWAITQDNRGIIYVGNTSGLLEFDGTGWRNLLAERGLIIRSVGCDSTGRVFLGARGNLGYLEPDSIGGLQFHSLLSSLPDSLQQFADVWRTLPTPEGVFFQTYSHIFRWYNGKFKIWSSDTGYHTLTYMNGTLYVREIEKGVLKLSGGKWVLPGGLSYFSDKSVYVMIPYDQQHILVGTEDDGLWVFDGKKLSPFAENLRAWLLQKQLYSGTKLDQDHFAFGTRRGGLLILDKKGKVTQLINEKSGLHDQTIWSIFVDRSGSLWLALNNGISRIDWSVPFRIYDKENGLDGAILSIRRFKNRLYVATTVGVYYSSTANRVDMKKPETFFRLVKNLQGQAFALDASGDELLAGTMSGTFVIRDTTARLLHTKWIRATALHTSETNPDSVWVGLDDGLALLHKEHGKWKDKGKVKGISGFVHTIVQTSDHTLWVGTVLKDAYHIDLHTMHAVHYGADKGIAGGEIDMYLWNGRIFAGMDNGLRVYNPANDMFEYITLGLPILKDTTKFVPEMLVSSDHSLWMNIGKGDHSQDYHLYHLRPTSNPDSLAIAPLPDILRFKGDLYSIYSDPISGDNWFGCGEQLVQWKKEYASDPGPEPNIMLRKVTTVPDDSLIWDGYAVSTPEVSLPYKKRNIRVAMALPSYIYSNQHEYQYRLEGFSLGWSQWSKEPFAVFTNLPSGSYVLHSRVHSATGVISEATILRLTIEPPWYETIWAFVGYGFLGLIMIGGIANETSRIRHKRLQKKLQIEEDRNRLMAAELQLQKSEIEKEQIRQRISGDLHDEIGSNLSSIALLSGLMEEKVSGEPEIKDRISRIQSLAETSAQSMRDIVWLVNPRNDSMPQLIERLRDTAYQQLDGLEVHFTANSETFHENYSLDFRRNIFLIYKEILQNIIRHADASDISIVIKEEGKKFKMEIQDNGKGFDVETVKRGNGLYNIASRVEMIGGELSFKSVPREGTKIGITANIP